MKKHARKLVPFFLLLSLPLSGCGIMAAGETVADTSEKAAYAAEEEADPTEQWAAIREYKADGIIFSAIAGTEAAGAELSSASAAEDNGGADTEKTEDNETALSGEGTGEEEEEEKEASYTYTDLSATVYATADLNIRSGPSTDFGSVGYYSSGSEITVTGKCNETGWYRVSFKDGDAYCSAKYTSSEKPAASSSSSGSSSSGSSSQSSSGIIQAKGNVSFSFLAKANNILSVVPSKYLSAFQSCGWHYYVSEADVDDTYCGGKYGSLKGVTLIEKKTIYLDYRDAALTATVHEFGHFVDQYLGKPSLSSEFADIFNAEAYAFKDAFNYSNGVYDVQELFAEGFKRYLTEPSTLKSACPQLYAYMQKTI